MALHAGRYICQLVLWLLIPTFVLDSYFWLHDGSDIILDMWNKILPWHFAKMTVTTVTFRRFWSGCYALLPNWSKWYSILARCSRGNFWSWWRLQVKERCWSNTSCSSFFVLVTIQPLEVELPPLCEFLGEETLEVRDTTENCFDYEGGER